MMQLRLMPDLLVDQRVRTISVASGHPVDTTWPLPVTGRRPMARMPALGHLLVSRRIGPAVIEVPLSRREGQTRSNLRVLAWLAAFLTWLSIVSSVSLNSKAALLWAVPCGGTAAVAAWKSTRLRVRRGRRGTVILRGAHPDFVENVLAVAGRRATVIRPTAARVRVERALALLAVGVVVVSGLVADSGPPQRQNLPSRDTPSIPGADQSPPPAPVSPPWGPQELEYELLHQPGRTR